MSQIEELRRRTRAEYDLCGARHAACLTFEALEAISLVEDRLFVLAKRLASGQAAEKEVRVVLAAGFRAAGSAVTYEQIVAWHSANAARIVAADLMDRFYFGIEDQEASPPGEPVAGASTPATGDSGSANTSLPEP